MSVGVIVVGVRADGDEHGFAVERESDVARPVAAAAKQSAAGEIANFLRGAARLQVSIVIREAHDRAGVADVDPLRLRTGRIESDAEWFVEAGGEGLHLLRAALGVDPAHHFDVSGLALRQKDIAVGSRTDQPGIMESGGVELHGKSRRHLGPCVRRTRNHMRRRCGRGRGVGLRKILQSNVMALPRRLRTVVGKGGRGRCGGATVVRIKKEAEHGQQAEGGNGEETQRTRTHAGLDAGEC